MGYVGQSIVGMTNRLLAAGKGRFVGDVYLSNMTHMAVVRSPYAHARIKGVGAGAALALPGVVGVVSGEEIARETSPIPQAIDALTMGAKVCKVYALAVGKARYVGEPVAAVVAEDRFTAYRAAALVEVAYEELPVVADAERALEPGSALVDESWGDNVMLHKVFSRGDAEMALRQADGTVGGVLRTHRYTTVPIEPRGYVADYDPYTEMLTVYASTQNPHPLRVFLAETLGMRESGIRVVQPHVGGAFGGKVPTFQEEPLIAYLSRKLCRPVKWIEERQENFLAGGHAREEVLHFEAGYRRDGTVTALRVKVVADVGAPSALCGWAMSFVSAFCIPAVYKIGNCHVELFSTVTNKCPWNGYRAFGKEAASFLMDRVMDLVAEEVGKDRAEVRYKNFIAPEEFPYEQVSGATLDSGNYAGALGQALKLAGYEDFRGEQAQARAKGRYLGIGIGYELVPEGCSLPNSTLLSGYDGCTVRVNPSGQVTVLTGVTSPGSGNETAIAQIVADELGANIADIKVLQGDTELCPYGLGNYSSRSVIIGGSAAGVAAREVRGKMVEVAARALEVSARDVEGSEGIFRVRGAPGRQLTFREVASLVYRHCYGREACEVEPGLEATRYFRMPNVYHQPEVQGRFSAYPSWPNGACVAVVEVDTETGVVKVARYAMVHDCGTTVNPLLADANLHGGIAQGLGGVLYEHLVYDENAQLKTATFMDYTIPTAMDVPSYEIAHQTTPSPFTPLGTKGAGESGIAAPLGAVVGAVEDALAQAGVKVRLLETPLTPSRVWRAIQAARSGQPRRAP